MKSARWISRLALVCTFYGGVTASMAVMAGNVTFVRRSTGNSHQVGETRHITGMYENGVNDYADADIPDGLPSVIAPLTADGEDSYSDTNSSADISYTGELAGTYDHQNVIDHTMESTFTSVLSGTGISQYVPHDDDAVDGNLKLSIDGDGVQFIDVSFEMDWQAGGILSGDPGFVGDAWFASYSVDIIVYRNANAVCWINGDQNGFSATTFDGVSHGVEGGSPFIDEEGDGSFGSVTIGNHFGLWAADNDVIWYEVSVSYEYDDYLFNATNPNPAAEGEFHGNGLFNWRFALEDSHID